MAPRRQRVLQIQNAIREILLHQWDPIGVATVAEAQDEYDSYIGGIYRLIASGAGSERIAAHLADIARDEMGLYPSHAGELLRVARELARLDVTL